MTSLLPPVTVMYARDAGGQPSPPQEREETRDRDAPAPAAHVYTAVFAEPGDVMPRALSRRVHLPWADPARLAPMMRAEAEHAYAVAGEGGVLALFSDLDRTEWWRMGDDGSERFALFRNLVPFADEDEGRRAARAVLDACDQARLDTLEAAKQAVVDVQAAAAEAARAARRLAWEEILAQVPRYLDLGEGSQADSAAILDADVPLSQILLQGPDVAALVGSLRHIQQRGRALADAVRGAGASPSPGAEALSAVESAAADLTLCVLVEATRHPVLHRIWRSVPELPASITARPVRRRDGSDDPVKNMIGSSTRAGGEAASQLRTKLVIALREASEANADFAVELRDPAVVWKFPPLIKRTLDGMGQHDPSVATRAAAERADEVTDEAIRRWLSIAASGAQTLAWLLGALPGVNAVLAMTSLVLGTAENVAAYHKLRRDNAAALAFLDPRQAVASEGGYAGLVLDVVFTVLDLPDVFSALKAARAAAPATDLTVAAASKLVAP